MHDSSISQQLHEITQAPLLTLAQERSLTRAVHHGNELTAQLAEGVIPPEKQELAQQLINQAETARQELISANTRLVISIAKKFKGHTHELNDLIQEGILGLMRATETFNPNTGNKFSTHATYWIRQRITLALTNTDRTIRYTRHVVEQLRQLNRTIDTLIIENEGADPTPEEIAMYMGPKWTPELVEDLLILRSSRINSLDAPVRNNLEPGETTWNDYLPDPNAITPEDIHETNVTHDLVTDALQELPVKHQAVIDLIFGLNNKVEFTPTEVASLFNTTTSTINGLRNRALQQLRDTTELEQWHDPTTDIE